MHSVHYLKEYVIISATYCD